MKKHLTTALTFALLNLPPLIGIIQLFNEGNSLLVILLSSIILVANVILFS
jgi:hypothetical protein